MQQFQDTVVVESGHKWWWRLVVTYHLTQNDHKNTTQHQQNYKVISPKIQLKCRIQDLPWDANPIFCYYHQKSHEA